MIRYGKVRHGELSRTLQDVPSACEVKKIGIGGVVMAGSLTSLSGTAFESSSTLRSHDERKASTDRQSRHSGLHIFDSKSEVNGLVQEMTVLSSLLLYPQPVIFVFSCLAAVLPDMPVV